MRASTTLAASLAVLSLAACGPKRIPGTSIRDTPDTRALVALVDQYRAAAERRDAASVLALVSPKYFDDAGTPDPADDIDAAQLRQRLAEDYAKVAALRLDIGVKAVDVDGDKAQAIMFYEQHYRIATRSGEVAKVSSDEHRMTFAREAGGWKVTSGL